MFKAYTRSGIWSGRLFVSLTANAVIPVQIALQKEEECRLHCHTNLKFSFAGNNSPWHEKNVDCRFELIWFWYLVTSVSCAWFAFSFNQSIRWHLSGRLLRELHEEWCAHCERITTTPSVARSRSHWQPGWGVSAIFRNFRHLFFQPTEIPVYQTHFAQTSLLPFHLRSQT